MENLISRQSIGNRLKQLRKSEGLSQTAFAARIGLNRGNYAQIEMGNQYPAYEVLINISREFAKSYEWILHGFDAQDIIDDLVGIGNSKNIRESPAQFTFRPAFRMEQCVVVKREQFSNYLLHFEDLNFLNTLPVISWPESLGENSGKRAFEIVDRLLAPTFHPSDIVICRQLSNLSELIPQKFYIVADKDELILLRHQLLSDENELVGALDSQYLKPKAIPLLRISQIWEVVAKLSHKIDDVANERELTSLGPELFKLRFELDRLKKNN